MTEDASTPPNNKPLPEQDGQDPALQRIFNADTTEIPDFSKNILAQLQSDRDNPLPCQYDEEFISTYFDQQFHLEITDPALLAQRIENFEKHLPACPPCHTLLGHIGEWSQTYRHYLCRQEEKLARFDISAQVLAAYQAQPKPNVIAMPHRKRWMPVALGSVAAAMFILVMFNPFTQTPPAMETASIDLGALEQALEADEADNRIREAALPRAEYSVNVMYESPEAYLFSSEEAEWITEKELLNPNADLSAAIPEE